MYGESTLSSLLGGLGSLGSIFALLSTETLKHEIESVTDSDERDISDEMLGTNIYKYKYVWEGKEQEPHLGLIAERAPQSLTFHHKTMVGLYEYIANLHATIKTLNRRLEKLEKTREN
jgi:hypothetical protein